MTLPPILLRRLPRAAVGVAVLAVSTVLVSAAGLVGVAIAQPNGRIVQIDSSNGKLDVVFTANQLPAGVSIDPSSIKLSIDGTPVKASAAPVEAGNASKVIRTAVLAIDTSGSMQGPGLTGAKAAATDFLGAVPADVRVGLVTFSDTAVVRVAPTTDRAALRQAVSGLIANGETALYDGTLLALRVAGSAGARTVVVLSDGADTRSKATLAAVRGQVATSKVLLDAVAFRTTDAQGAVLGQIASSAGGQVVAAGQGADITRAFAQSAREVSSQLLVTATIPKAFAGRSATVAVSGVAGGVTVTDSAFLPLSAAKVSAVPRPAHVGPIPVKVAAGRLRSQQGLAIALAVLFVGLTLLLSVAALSVRRGRSMGRLRRRLAAYSVLGAREPAQEESTAFGGTAVARSAVEFAGRLAAKGDLDSTIATKLEAAGIPIKPSEWIVVNACSAVTGALLLLLVTRGSPVGAVLGLAIGAFAPPVYLSIKGTRRRAAFLTSMPDTLQLMAGSMSAGYSLPQAVDTVVREGAEPIASEFGRALVESRLGVPVEDALEGVATRMASKDFAWVVMAIRIQREVGGNLAEVLTTVAATLRERDRIRRQVKVLSAEGRLSAWILGGLPVVFGLYLLLVRRSYIHPLYSDPIGFVLLGAMAIAFVIGVLWMRKVVTIDV